jgi:hypothetical protein
MYGIIVSYYKIKIKKKLHFALLFCAVMLKCIHIRRCFLGINRLKTMFLAHNCVKNSRNPSRITPIFALFCTQKQDFYGAKQFWVRDFLV